MAVLEYGSDHNGLVCGYLRDFSFEPSDIASLYLSVERRLVISARRSPLQAVERLRQAVRRGEPIASSVVLLTHLLRDQADVLTRIVRMATGKVDNIEDNLLSGQLKFKRADLGALRRVLVRCSACWRPSRPPCSGCCSARPCG
jgi:zinc transporter